MIQSLLQCLEAAELNLQKDIISIIPEIVDDASLSIVVSTLRQLMEQDTKMTVPVLDALGNLNLDTEQLLPICNSALATIGSTAVENLPIVIRFLLQVFPRPHTQSLISVTLLLYPTTDDLHRSNLFLLYL